MIEEQHKNITASEEKELDRVYTTLCNFLPKSKLYASLRPLKERRERILSHKKSPEIVKIFRNDNPTQGAVPEEELDQELTQLKTRIQSLRAEIEEYDSDPHKKIKASDLNECLKSLGQFPSKKEIEEMIWEVDENLDECVDWSEFRLMFQRNLSDVTGLEPFQLFNLCMFMMYDKDGSGKVTVDETMHMLYARYGKDKLESQMRALFGDDLKTADGDGELTFQEYIKAVSIRVPNTALAPEPKKGKNNRQYK